MEMISSITNLKLKYSQKYKFIFAYLPVQNIEKEVLFSGIYYFGFRDFQGLLHIVRNPHKV